MIEAHQINNDLLEEIQDELTPRVIGNCGHTQQLTGEMVKSLYYLISNYLTQNAKNQLPNSIVDSLGEIP